MQRWDIGPHSAVKDSDGQFVKYEDALEMANEVRDFWISASKSEMEKTNYWKDFYECMILTAVILAGHMAFVFLH